MVCHMFCNWYFLFYSWDSISVASLGAETFCSVLHHRKYCCISQYVFLDGACEAAEKNV
uniref:SFT2 domain containing 1 n=1 Tax=Chrysemys picta bellii TaxID=8478 RepID=A0A8C3I439_CHRPI